MTAPQAAASSEPCRPARVRWPIAGHTLTATGTFESSFGGKGFNEALGVGRLGVPTWLVGRVGESDGVALAEQLEGSGEGVNCDGVTRCEEEHTGLAVQINTTAADVVGSRFTVVCQAPHPH